MARKYRLPPGLDLWDPPIQYHDRGNASHEKDGYKKHDETPGGDAELRAVERIERQPGAYVHETRAVQEEIDYGREYFIFSVLVEITIPGDGAACSWDED